MEQIFEESTLLTTAEIKALFDEGKGNAFSSIRAGVYSVLDKQREGETGSAFASLSEDDFEDVKTTVIQKTWEKISKDSVFWTIVEDKTCEIHCIVLDMETLSDDKVEFKAMLAFEISPNLWIVSKPMIVNTLVFDGDVTQSVFCSTEEYASIQTAHNAKFPTAKILPFARPEQNDKKAD